METKMVIKERIFFDSNIVKVYADQGTQSNVPANGCVDGKETWEKLLPI